MINYIGVSSITKLNEEASVVMFLFTNQRVWHIKHSIVLITAGHHTIHLYYYTLYL